MYYGEINIYQENLDSFLNIAKELKGLNKTGGGGEEEASYDADTPKQTYMPTLPTSGTQGNNDTVETTVAAQNDSTISQTYSEDQITSSMAVALSKHEFSGDKHELDGKVETMMG